MYDLSGVLLTYGLTLDLGANDYVVKPFYMGELLARIRVAQRLSKKEDEEIKKYQKDYDHNSC